MSEKNDELALEQEIERLKQLKANLEATKAAQAKWTEKPKKFKIDYTESKPEPAPEPKLVNLPMAEHFEMIKKNKKKNKS